MTRIQRTRLALAATSFGIALAGAGAAQAQKPSLPAPRPRQTGGRGFQLFSGATTASLEANRVYCGVTGDGHLCTDVTGDPVLGGGSWPRGTPDQYIYNTGIQIAGVIPSSAGFPWAGDTVGAWALDTRGPGEHMRGVSGVYSSLVPGTLLAWPSAAYVRDTSLFGPALIGRPIASQQDTWMRYWDGDTTLLGGRSHTMGVLVEQRTLSFDHPAGNEDIVYILFRITNITARNASVYQGLTAAGYTPQDVADIAALGAEFQRLSEARFQVQIPDGGYTIANAYVDLTVDADVGDATNNYESIALPFAMGVTWKADFREGTWRFPAEIFHAPFATAPGFVGTKMLRTPANRGVSTYTGYAAFSPKPLDVRDGYGYMTGAPTRVGACQFAPPRPLCFLPSSPSDQVYMQSSGPFTLAPGQSVVLALAYVFAPALLTNPGRPSYDLNQFIGNVNLPPGVPPAGDRLVQGLDTLRVLDAALGWVSHADQDGSGAIEEGEVTTVRGSLLWKARVAQAMFDNRFQLPAAPDAPDFFLVPGSNKVTVVWKASATEASGDPFFVVASDPASPLYDPNFRRSDVEGYRVWRGSSPASLGMIAQFDYAGTVISDYTGAFFNGDYFDPNGANKCAPELGITSSCPAAFAVSPTPASPHHDIPLSYGGTDFPGAVQIPLGGRMALPNGTVFITTADTAVTGGGSGHPRLRDTKVPFVFVDSTTRNGTRYYYAVTAFDVNSLQSGPSSLESGLLAKAVAPRLPSGQEAAGGLGAPEFIRPDGSVVAAIAAPTIDPATGIFSGPPPQASVTFDLTGLVPQIVNDGVLTLKVIDVTATSGNIAVGANGTFTLVVQGSGAPDTMVIPVHAEPLGAQFGMPTAYGFTFATGNISQSQSARFGGDSTFLQYANLGFTQPAATYLTSWGRGDLNGAPSSSSFNGPRWWSGAANENTLNPNGGLCAPANGGCIGPPNINRSAGALPGVTSLMHLQSYSTIPSAPYRDLEVYMSLYTHAADFKVYWGANGAIDSVVDVVHGVSVAFNDGIRASWGILNDSSFTNTTTATTLDGNNARLTWADAMCVKPYPPLGCGGAAQTPAFLMNHARLTPIAVGSSLATTTDLAALPTTGNGFIFYLNGHFFMMQMAALPTAGTVWNARFYSGTIRGTPGSFAFTPQPGPINIPGLRVQIRYQGATLDASVTADALLQRIHTVPDPYYAASVAGDPFSPPVIRFVHVPSQSIIRIYSSSGILVALLTNNDPTGGGEVVWNVRSRNDMPVAAGVYFYHVETPDRRSRIGRFTVIR